MSQESERIYTINLGKVLLSQSQHRAVRAVNMIREFARHHMKTDDIKIDEELAHQVWARGVRSPPRKIRVRMSRTDEGRILVSPYNEQVEEDAKPAEIAAKVQSEAGAAPAVDSSLHETPSETETADGAVDAEATAEITEEAKDAEADVGAAADTEAIPEYAEATAEITEEAKDAEADVGAAADTEAIPDAAEATAEITEEAKDAEADVGAAADTEAIPDAAEAELEESASKDSAENTPEKEPRD